MWRQCLAIKSSALRKTDRGGEAGEVGQAGQAGQGEQGDELGEQATGRHDTRERPPHETPGGACGFVSPGGTATCVGGDGAEATAAYSSPPNNATVDAEQVAGRADHESEMVNVWLVSAELTQLLPEAERGVPLRLRPACSHPALTPHPSPLTPHTLHGSPPPAPPPTSARVGPGRGMRPW